MLSGNFIDCQAPSRLAYLLFSKRIEVEAKLLNIPSSLRFDKITLSPFIALSGRISQAGTFLSNVPSHQIAGNAPSRNEEMAYALVSIEIKKITKIFFTAIPCLIEESNYFTQLEKDQSKFFI